MLAPLWAFTALWHRRRRLRCAQEAFRLGWLARDQEPERDRRVRTYFTTVPITQEAVRAAVRISAD